MWAESKGMKDFNTNCISGNERNNSKDKSTPQLSNKPKGDLLHMG